MLLYELDQPITAQQEAGVGGEAPGTHAPQAKAAGHGTGHGESPAGEEG